MTETKESKFLAFWRALDAAVEAKGGQKLSFHEAHAIYMDAVRKTIERQQAIELAGVALGVA